METGRDAPCPCGGGKKYKNYCMLKNVTSADDLDYRRLSEVNDRLLTICSNMRSASSVEQLCGWFTRVPAVAGRYGGKT